MAQESINAPYLVLTGTIFLAIVVTFVLFKPQLTEWQTKRADITSLTTQLKERQQFLATIDQKTAELAANAGYDQELSVVLPADESFDDVLRLLDRQAATAGVQIKKVNNTTASVQTANRVARALGESVEAPTNVTVHGAIMEVEGSYQQIRQFLGLLENAARFTDVSEIALSQAADRPDVLGGSLTTHFYSLSTAP